MHPPLSRAACNLLLAPSLILLLVLLLALPQRVEAAGTGDLLAVGQLRLQSQRLAKLYLQSGLQIQADSAQAQLHKAVQQFEGALGELAPYARQSRTAASLARTQALWAELRQAIKTPYGAPAAQRVLALSDDLMLASGKLSLLIEEQGEGGMGRLLDLSLRQGMLAQRLARLYLMGVAGDRSHGRQVDVEQARREFNTALEELAAARDNPPAVRGALELARTQWLFFDQALVGGGSGAGSDRQSQARNVTTTSERIAEVLADVSRQYSLAYGTTQVAAAPGAARRN
ncbi:MAG TPA: type IV pili methyl-accepting chemotaxis transducer N-terminal domain-containing protein [Azospira sp.]|nr:type IV pili methyl-accepting chemotaxis transducer N-terminal domain-containing protein [Azospira sp.]